MLLNIINDLSPEDEISSNKFEISYKDFVSNNLHLGHLKKVTHKSMIDYVFFENNLSIIKYQSSFKMLQEAKEFLKLNSNPLFVFLKRNTSSVVSILYEKGFNAVTLWQNGFLTNFNQVFKNCLEYDYLLNLADKTTSQQKKRLKKLSNYFKNTNITEKPSVLFLSDLIITKSIIDEAKLSRIPIIAIADANSCINGIDYPIPANDDSLSGVELIVNYLIND